MSIYTGSIKNAKTKVFKFWLVYWWDMCHCVAVFDKKPKWDKKLETWSFDEAIIDNAPPELFQALGVAVHPDKALYESGRSIELMSDPIQVKLELPVDISGNSMMLVQYRG